MQVFLAISVSKTSWGMECPCPEASLSERRVMGPSCPRSYPGHAHAHEQPAVLPGLGQQLHREQGGTQQ